ncbi:MAG TPA: bifunctional isocitrate dehydrogenase kinase/phosphatase [Thermoanaerobaculia bacterium]|jgi:isocitrate dehydrogenase kinase/phosphatase|nr:bifunctional isocitrate dehydrogenase kinase/phosphatase [Thermoanaerobaculia bacterium]
MDLASAAARGAETIHGAFEDHHQYLRAITRRVARRFEERDWEGIGHDTVKKLDLPARSVMETVTTLHGQLGEALADRALWTAMKEAYTRAILGRDDFEIAQTYFNSITRKVFPRGGVDPAIDYTADEFPLPYRGWEMASARMYAVRRVDAGVVQRVLEDAGFQAPFRDLEGDATLVAERLERGIVEAFGSPEIEAFDVLRPVFFRNKGAYVVGRVKRGGAVLPVALALLNDREGLEVDAVLHTEDEISIVFSFARWDFHVDVASPREVIGFLKSILPKKRVAELYISLGYKKHGKTEFYRDLMGHIAETSDQFILAPGQRGLVMAVFTLPSYEFVFKVINDAFPAQKNTTRQRVMEKYRTVELHDRVGRLVGFQEFEHLTFPKARFDPELLEKLLDAASRTLSVNGSAVTVHHCYVERRIDPLDLFLEENDEENAVAAALDWGRCLKELAAANIFPGDVLLKNFGVTRHGRVLSYDYDELCRLTDCVFREIPTPRDEQEELAAEPWFTVGENDIFPEELRAFLGLQGRVRDSFLREHGDLFGLEFWRELQERHRRGEVVSFYPYNPARRLRVEAPATVAAAL